MKNGLLITGACSALLLAGCSTVRNVGSPGVDYDNSTGSGVSTKGEYQPGNPATDPRGGWESRRYQHGIDRPEGRAVVPAPNNQ